MQATQPQAVLEFQTSSPRRLSHALRATFITLGASSRKPPGKTRAAIQNEAVRIVGMDRIMRSHEKKEGDGDHFLENILLTVSNLSGFS